MSNRLASFITTLVASSITSLTAAMSIPALLPSLALTAGCSGASPDEPMSDAGAPTVPIDPTGRYAITSSFSLGAPPPSAVAVLDELRAATDGADDPSRYLIDLMVARLPDGHVKTVTRALAPYLAAYVNERIATVAPRFIDGTRALVTGIARVAHRFGTDEQLVIDHDGSSIRTLVGLRFARDDDANNEISVELADLGLADITAETRASLSDDRLAIAEHALRLPYAAMLRVGLDRAVIPSVVPAARDLAEALHQLADCARLGVITAQWLGVGTPDFYARACSAGLTALAVRIYGRIDAIDPPNLAVELAGAARVVDRDRDGAIDEITSGVWTGASSGVTLAGTWKSAH